MYEVGVCLVDAIFQAKSGCHLCQIWDHLMGVTIEFETSFHLCWTWDHLAGATRHAKASYCCLEFVDLWEILEKARASCLCGVTACVELLLEAAWEKQASG